jgi:hypothetical protein
MNWPRLCVPVCERQSRQFSGLARLLSWFFVIHCAILCILYVQPRFNSHQMGISTAILFLPRHTYLKNLQTQAHFNEKAYVIGRERRSAILVPINKWISSCQCRFLPQRQAWRPIAILHWSRWICAMIGKFTSSSTCKTLHYKGVQHWLN